VGAELSLLWVAVRKPQLNLLRSVLVFMHVLIVACVVKRISYKAQQNGPLPIG
jgi:hypothetical protein